MSKLDLALYIAAAGLGLFLCFLLLLLGAFLYVIGRGWLIELQKPSQAAANQLPKQTSIGFWARKIALVFTGILLLWLGSRL